jgi:8-oxo-dGTP diphosphatase
MSGDPAEPAEPAEPTDRVGDVDDRPSAEGEAPDDATIGDAAGVTRAAGGVVWRRSVGEPSTLEVVLVHRPKYDDWSLPKGKVEPGETIEQTARREVAEETGLTCRLGPELPAVGYADAQGRPKTVRYWAMTVEAQTEHPADDEVDDWRWLPEAEVLSRLTYERDREVVAALLSVVGRDGPAG